MVINELTQNIIKHFACQADLKILTEYFDFFLDKIYRIIFFFLTSRMEVRKPNPPVAEFYLFILAPI
jgi:hypothetical protein